MPEAAVLDDAASLVYLNNRYHDPTLGTFISVDPLVTITGEPYVYASGNPTTLSDPTGLIGGSSATWSRYGQCRPRCSGGGGGPATAPPPSTPSSYPNQTAPPGESSPVSSPPTFEDLLGPSSGDDYSVLCGPPSGAPSSQTAGSCGWAKDLPGLGEALVDAVTSEAFLTFAKNIGVGVIAVAGGVLVCGATAGTGCIIIASAVVGAAANIGSEEALDCAYRECGEFSIGELSGDAFQGAVVGGSSGYLNTRLSAALGADKPAVGLLSATWSYGAGATGAALVDQAGERAALAFVKYLVEQTVGGS